MNPSRVRNEEQKRDQSPFELLPGMHLHLVGIGGSGISAIAWVLLGRGYEVSGSDLQRNELTAALSQAGATVYEGHSGAHIAGADALVVSSAVPATNPEVVAANDAGIPVLKRSHFLGYLMADSVGIAVAGTHGKTTTTSMIAHTLLETGRDPSLIVGGILPSLGRNGRAGQGEHFVVEADEYDHMFLGLRPRVEVITNVEHDHPDFFATAADYLDAFRRFVQRLPEGGRLVACTDDEGVRQLLAQLEREDVEVVTYGLGADSPQPHIAAVDVRANQLGGSDFVVLEKGATLGLVRVRVPGEHNVRNALACIAVCRGLDVPVGDLLQALASFGGVGRRFQMVGEINDMTIIDDYAHHPTEIRATLAAARQHHPGRRLWAVWQPHTYSRTQMLLSEFATSFEDADRVLVLDIFRSREKKTPESIDAAQVVAAMAHPHALYVGRREDAAAHILDRVRPGDVILTLGAGDGDEVGKWILEGLRERVAGQG
ncbi:MAG TPA: UDP-N-acetylmuramate--L-alanine ligase [Candidatus Sulfomarinibacteraceae bacterium]|nr:UDP-N-acetylmuramate--L-alanine ligase [Candidatus Sulfomarinibacteraceae bacterium]